ncbi:MAG: hypothetical protein A2X52_13060 [Candidatus Rokubacteria bacterium GWC2_70_16]|nr:MAG: hypothetical protein A2X52_13060 [Candidatus Rokubacteria bacterium GWC2_70_16]OGL18541.1 MAG: hypothetical protein A3K12_06815 [Candidatus Rokubacteria bacterium RIFCSPLOWO2_12_FULL_71_19]
MNLRNPWTTRSRRRISPPITSRLSLTSPGEAASRARSSSRWTIMAFSGFFTSWATPEVSRPRAASLAE